MAKPLEITVDKFTFRVATDRHYTPTGIWVQRETGNRFRVGLADYVQQRSGDIAFASVKPAGTRLAASDPLVEIETIKTMLNLESPVSGTVVEVNPALQQTPEIINQDPYGNGWLAVIEPMNCEAEWARLLEPDAYFSLMQVEAKEELNKQ